MRRRRPLIQERCLRVGCWLSACKSGDVLCKADCIKPSVGRQSPPGEGDPRKRTPAYSAFLEGDEPGRCPTASEGLRLDKPEHKQEAQRLGDQNADATMAPTGSFSAVKKKKCFSTLAHLRTLIMTSCSRHHLQQQSF
ncbi:uncharacterized protein LOC127594086 isoform X13 [Hippocampus zosterae]|uniref:uncharacterized protein LOC127594086 isoform X11 n=1 Tax=Hippocampus zosterae TaxID=109293 RepID=UPI00223CB321|nr:uncharacterized protein LOC127594086 isoform X11 [Hippocampus zosterae]XP_051911962.1 uncharacterized protein LOC127594086 isoform X12 [Hippocampus zosterae]XP_051911963.1 uncharacterized protein LOC127594086 isoform X13 [Hippocampus zosterae]